MGYNKLECPGRGKEEVEGRHQIVVREERLFCPRLGRVGVMSLKGSFLWQKCVGTLYLFVVDK